MELENLKIPYDTIKDFIFLGVKWEYESYDYKAARTEHRQELLNNSNYMLMSKHSGFHALDCDPPIPYEIRQNHIVWRTGKLRNINIAPDGVMYKFLIGNKFNKTFYLDDVGVKVKPRIYLSDDKLGLISKGLAIEEHL